MIQLTKDLWLKADSNCYIVGKARESRGKGVELLDPTTLPPPKPSLPPLRGRCAKV